MPRREPIGVRVARIAQADVGVAHRLELEWRLVLELLHEMTVPAQS
jgi:hypothetical protein